MTIEIKYYKASIPVMFKITLISFALLNGLAYLIFTILLKTPFEELFSRNWIILVFIPLTQGLIRPCWRGFVIRALVERPKTVDKNENKNLVRTFRDIRIRQQ